jgi:hypothetical protein
MSTGLTPITRQEHYLSAIAGETELNIPKPITREEIYLEAIYDELGSISDPTQEEINIAVTNYFEEEGIDALFIDSADIAEVLEG